MKLPKAHCPRCSRPIAARPVPGRISKGRLWRHDDTGVLRIPGEPLVSCPGSLEMIEMPLPARQLELDVSELPCADVVDDEMTAALF
ncbi:hypothetical protein [Streptomyces sp. NPDC053560]|uniref:hypothetical protein n=1 Tax=Streptomyces sp. NPDC053560 TaxID=3365711 RepID=UPI0037CFDDCA